MTDCKNEKISAFMDGEEPAGQTDVVGHLLRDEGLRARWSRYHLISDCLRGHLPATLSDVSAHIRRGLKDEPTILSPKRGRPAAFKPLAGLAIAASVAMIALIAVQMGHQTEPARPASDIMADVAATAAPPARAPARSFTFQDSPLLPAGPGVSVSVADQRMKNYLVSHNEFRSNGRINGIPPYVRVVTLEARE